MDEQFLKASAGFTLEQERLNKILHAEHDRLTQVLEMNKQLLDQLSIEVKASRRSAQSVTASLMRSRRPSSSRGTMEAYKVDQKLKVDVIHEILSKEVRSMHGSITEVNTMTLARMDVIERVVGTKMQNRPVGEGGNAPGGARGYQIRIPDPKQWNLTVLKDGETRFLPWRKSFELQVRTIWAGLDVVLEALREETSPVGRESYNRLVSPHIP